MGTIKIACINVVHPTRDGLSQQSDLSINIALNYTASGEFNSWGQFR
jgi:hypothetical protein